MPTSSFASYLSAGCFSISFAEFSSSAGLSVLMFLMVLFMGLSSYFYFPWTISTIPGQQEPDLSPKVQTSTCNFLPGSYLDIPQVTQTQYNKNHMCILPHICFSLSVPCLSKQHHSPSCYPRSNLEVDLDFSAFSLPSHSINH